MAHVGKIKVPVEIICSCDRERWQAMNVLLSEQLEEARRWHLAAVNEKLAAQADAERLFTALDGYIMARITGTDLCDYDDLAERAARAHRSLVAATPDPPDGLRLAFCECGEASTYVPACCPRCGSKADPTWRTVPAASPDERLREAGERLAQAVARVCGEGHPALGMWRAALAAADREAPDEPVAFDAAGTPIFAWESERIAQHHFAPPAPGELKDTTDE